MIQTKFQSLCIDDFVRLGKLAGLSARSIKASEIELPHRFLLLNYLMMIYK